MPHTSKPCCPHLNNVCEKTFTNYEALLSCAIIHLLFPLRRLETPHRQTFLRYTLTYNLKPSRQLNSVTHPMASSWMNGE